MSSFISVCVLFAAIGVLSSADTRTHNQKYQEARKKCQEDPATKLDEETLKNAFKGEINKSIFGPHAVCIYRHLGILDKQSNVNKVELRNNLDYVITDTDKLEAVVKECGKRRITPEETAVEIFKCTKKAMAPYLGLN